MEFAKTAACECGSLFFCGDVSMIKEVKGGKISR